MDFKLKNIDIDLIVSRIANVHYFEFLSQYRTIDDSHDFCELLYVDNGSITVNSENYKGVISSNQVIIHRPNEVHSLSCTDDVAPDVIIIGFECMCPFLEPFASTPITLTYELKKMLAEVMKEGINAYEPPYNVITTEMTKRKNAVFGADQMLKIRLEAFLISLIRSFKHNDNTIKNEASEENKMSVIYQYITEHYMEKIQLEHLCFLFATNKTSLCYNFKKNYGVTIGAFIDSLKAKEAKRLLRENNLSVTEISERLGFNSIHYFCRFFKGATGMSPKEYTKTLRSNFDL